MEYNKKIMNFLLHSSLIKHTLNKKQHDLSVFSKMTNLISVDYSVAEVEVCMSMGMQIIWWVTGYYVHVEYIIIKSTRKSFLYCAYFDDDNVQDHHFHPVLKYNSWRW